MKIKEIQAGIKITRNYDSYQASIVAELETEEDPEKVGAELMEKASAIVSKKMGVELDKKLVLTGDKETEVGAAWPDKKFSDRLSVKNSETGEWKDVELADLEETPDGYRQKKDGGLFIFRKIPKEKRTNNKMPTYRIYRIERSRD
ncbi:MAG: hypothetical protein KJ905_01745 [Nanoarchaeota archaeon]|nr:hypothetical protein [Nanoarchaeota archaeon]MBU1501477.1 hypothetical protein [Nanoarchaeota archaeon]